MSKFENSSIGSVSVKIDVTAEPSEEFRDVAYALGFVRVATCHNKCGADTERSFTCSECGYEAWTYGVSFCEPDEFKFCPHCGRKVVSDV